MKALASNKDILFFLNLVLLPPFVTCIKDDEPILKKVIPVTIYTRLALVWLDFVPFWLAGRRHHTFLSRPVARNLMPDSEVISPQRQPLFPGYHCDTPSVRYYLTYLSLFKNIPVYFEYNIHVLLICFF